jgi:cobalt transporter subunit CbtB
MQHTIATTQTKALTLSVAAQLLASLMLGAVLLYGVGFSHIDLAHNASHDTRHSFAFPCH